MSKKLKLPEYAKYMQITRQTALNWYHAGTLPHPAEQISPRIILVEVPDNFNGPEITPQKIPQEKTIAYCRVSTNNQKESLKNQKLSILEYANGHNIKIDKTIEEIGSGFNENRTKLNKILKDPTIKTIIVEHRERLARSNFQLIESSLKAQGRNIIIVNNNDIEDDLVREITDFMVSKCGVIYGKRGAQRVKKSIEKNNKEKSDNNE